MSSQECNSGADAPGESVDGNVSMSLREGYRKAGGGAKGWSADIANVEFSIYASRSGEVAAPLKMEGPKPSGKEKP